MTVKPPAYAVSVLERLEKAGYQAYFVGGCVRDMLLQRRPLDWDVCTSARPEETERLFRKTIPTGKKHGTITVQAAGKSVEVTTFRTEGTYSGHRRPEQVTFVPELREDLRRRDFTMNAIAMDARGALYDPFDGRADISARHIRAVGDPAARFEEDALRMLRAFRFSAKLGFTIEPATRSAIDACAPLCAALSPERIQTELEGVLRAERPEILSEMLESGLLDRYVLPGSAVDLARLHCLPKKKPAGWAGLCAVLARAGRIESAETFLKALRLDGDTIRACVAGVSAALSQPPEDRIAWKRLLAASGEEAAFCAACALEALSVRGALKQLREILRSGECRSVKQLALGGEDLLRLGFHGKEVGAALEKLLEAVILDPQKNDRLSLLEIAKALK